MTTVESHQSSSQYLTFEVSNDLYAIEILDLREIISFHGATRVPMAPASIRGLINLRGSAVPVLDLALKFGSVPTEVSKRTCVVILDGTSENDRGAFGILADSVSEVIELSAEEIEPAPDFGATIATEFLSGLARVGEEFVPVLDIGKLLSEGEAGVRRAANENRLALDPEDEARVVDSSLDEECLST